MAQAQESPLNGLLQEWKRRRELGQLATPEELCANCPEWLEELRHRIRLLEVVDRHTVGNTVKVDEAAPTVRDAVAAERSELKVVQQAMFGALRLHGSGGLGEVYQAQDLDLGRNVAIKFLKDVTGADPVTRSQFLLEAEVTGQLDHPGVVPVYGLGTHGEQPFYVMRFVSGGTLQQALDEFHEAAQPSMSRLKALIGHFRSACETVAYAHSRGIVHCDLKPGNILLGKYGETLVADWGSALFVARDPQAKASGESTIRPVSQSEISSSSSSTRPWTPAYMSPEQIPGSADPVTPASDIFSLGATLYHLLLGRNHLYELMRARKPTREEMFEWIHFGRAAKPRAVKPWVPRALEAICLKAMALRPADRYASALDLARDLENWRIDGRVSVYREPLLERMVRFVRRHPTAAAVAAGTVTTALLLAIGSSFWFRGLAGREEKARITVENARDERLKTTAVLAAEMLANEIDVRWHTLEAAADSPEVLRLLDRANAIPAKLKPPTDPEVVSALHQWLTRVTDANPSLEARAWSVYDAEGRQQARVPRLQGAKFNEVIGKSFRFRDYFHGLGRDLPADSAEAANVKPIGDVYRSIAFLGQSDGLLRISFVAPVKDERPNAARPVAGVLTMSLYAAKFSSLDRVLGKGQLLTLIDLRPSFLTGSAREGLILHHHDLNQLRTEGKVTDQNWPHLEEGLVRELQKLRPRVRVGDVQLPIHPEKAYRDPVGESSAPWLAAFAPVVVRSRPGLKQQDTGLVVVVQERAGE